MKSSVGASLIILIALAGQAQAQSTEQPVAAPQPRSIPADPNRKPLYTQIMQSPESQDAADQAKLDSIMKNLKAQSERMNQVLDNPSGAAPAQAAPATQRQPASPAQLELRQLTPEEQQAAQQLTEQLRKMTESLNEQQKSIEQ